MRPTRAPKASTVKTVPSMILYEANAQLVNDVHQSGPLTNSVGGAHRDSLVSAQLPRVPTNGPVKRLSYYQATRSAHRKPRQYSAPVPLGKQAKMGGSAEVTIRSIRWTRICR
jgi:hypothetical protein